jgi:hypothetical protein
MGRPSLGNQAKSKSITVRLTEAEEQALAQWGGTARKALRRLVDNQLSAIAHPGRGTDLPVVKPAPAAAQENAMQDPDRIPTPTGFIVPAGPGSTGSVTHRHRRVRVVDEKWEMGAPVKVWACDCGEVLA